MKADSCFSSEITHGFPEGTPSTPKRGPDLAWCLARRRLHHRCNRPAAAAAEAAVAAAFLALESSAESCTKRTRASLMLLLKACGAFVCIFCHLLANSDRFHKMVALFGELIALICYYVIVFVG